MKTFLILAIFALNSIAFAADFSYTVHSPLSENADDYIVNIHNAEIQTEGSVIYWKPAVGTATFDRASAGEITYHFELEQPIAEARLFTRVSTFHWTYSQGHNFIYGSTDGITWQLLSEATPPEFGTSNTQPFNGVLPENFVGSKNIWLKIELNSYGTNAQQGGIWTNTAQHSRYDINNDNVTLQLDVDYQTAAIPAEFDFSYTITDPSAESADDYIVDIKNAEIQIESPVLYWKPTVGTAQFDQAAAGEITYHFELPKPIAEANLLMRTTSFHWSYSQGHNFIYASLNGIDWELLTEATPPEFAGANTQVINDLLPDNFIGSKDIWLKVELNSYGTRGAEGGIFTNTAQHSRYVIDSDTVTMQLQVNYQSATNPLPVAEPSGCTGVVKPNLDMNIPSLNFVFQEKVLNIWVDLEYYGTSENGELLWKLKDVGENTQPVQ
ncbi:MAG: hypothetical protein methR_P0313 [Methyloprofundus sp.]|nr:MAG: hypothetical protein methR_P0313 [Methyloprofundus sp.]